MPKTNQEYWQTKLDRNVERDQLCMASLRAMGWRVHVIWECETKIEGELALKLKEFIDRCND